MQMWGEIKTGIIRGWRNFFFCLILCLTTITCLSPIGLPYPDYSFARWVSVYLLGAYCLICIAYVAKRGGETQLPKWLVAFVGLAILQSASFFYLENVGQVIRSLTITLSAIGIVSFCYIFRPPIAWIRFVVGLTVLLILAASFSGIFWRHQLFTWETDILGSLFGNRNGTSIYLALVLPLFLFAKPKKYSYLLYLLILLTTYVILVNRTRSAWVMLLLYLIMSCFIWQVKKSNSCKIAFLRLVISISLGIICLNFIPNALNWKQPQPYLSSLQSVASFEKSNRRDKIWAVAFAIFNKNPVFGAGAGQFAVEFPNFLGEPSGVGYAEGVYPNTSVAFNEYLHHAAEHGVAGFFMIVTILIGVPLYALKCLLALPKGESFDESAQTLLIPFFIISAFALDACFDYPIKRPEILPIYISMLGLVSPCGEKGFSVYSAWPIWWFRKIATLCAILLVLIASLRAGSLVLRDVSVSNKSFPVFWQAYKLWPWDSEWPFILEGINAPDPEKTETVLRNLKKYWPIAPEAHLSAARISDKINLFDLANEFYRGLFSFWHGTNPATYNAYKKFISNPFLPEHLPPIDQELLNPYAPLDQAELEALGIQWGQAQSFVKNWNGALLLSGSWNGSFMPYVYKQKMLVPVFSEEVQKDQSQDYYSPTPLSSSEIFLSGRKQVANDRSYDIFLYNAESGILRNLTENPEVGSGSYCVHPESRSISWVQAESQHFSTHLPTEFSKLDKQFSHPVAFLQCVWSSDKVMLGVSRDQGKYKLWRCDLTDRNLTCRDSEALKELNHFSEIYQNANADIILTALINGELFRKPYRVNVNELVLEDIYPKLFQSEGDILDFDGNNNRVGFHSFYKLGGHEELEGTVYKHLAVGDDIYGIVADSSRLRRLVKLVSNAWEDIEIRGVPKVLSSQKDIREIWIRMNESKNVVQAFYYGELNPEAVVIWWHGGGKENVSPRYNPYFDYLNQIGYGVLAVNFPGSTGRGHNYEEQYLPEFMKDSVLSVVKYLKKNKVKKIVSWSVSRGAVLQDLILSNRIPISGMVDQVSFPPSTSRRKEAATQGIPYFNIQGQLDFGYRKEETYNYSYLGGHDITQFSQFSSMASTIKNFLSSVPEVEIDQHEFSESDLIVDPGHDGNESDHNVSGPLKEASLTFELARSLNSNCLKDKRVANTREGSVTLMDRETSMFYRDQIRRSTPVPFISLHFNASKPSHPSKNLSSIFIPPLSSQLSIAVAQSFITNLQNIGIEPKASYPELEDKATKVSEGVFERSLKLSEHFDQAPCTFVLEATYYDDIEENLRLQEKDLAPDGSWNYARIDQIANAICPSIRQAIGCR